MKDKLTPLCATVSILAVLCVALWMARYEIHQVSTPTGPVVIRLNRWTGETERARWRDNDFSSWSKVY